MPALRSFDVSKYLFRALVAAPLAFCLPSGSAQIIQTHSVEIPYGENIFVSQRQSNWCWAACNEMLLKSAGITFTQEEQAEKLFGARVNRGAGPDYSRAAPTLAGEYARADGTMVAITPVVSYLAQHNASDPEVIIDSLKNGRPLVMATTQHGRVCIGADYVTNGALIQITRLKLLDPASGLFPVPRIVVMSMPQFVNEGLFGFMTFEVTARPQVAPVHSDSRARPAQDEACYLTADDKLGAALRLVIVKARNNFLDVRGEKIDSDEDSTTYDCILPLSPPIEGDVVQHNDDDLCIGSFVLVEHVASRERAQQLSEEYVTRIVKLLGAQSLVKEVKPEGRPEVRNFHSTAFRLVDEKVSRLSVSWSDRRPNNITLRLVISHRPQTAREKEKEAEEKQKVESAAK